MPTASRPRKRMLRALAEYEIEGLEDADPLPPGAARDASSGPRARPAATCSRTSRLAEDAGLRPATPLQPPTTRSTTASSRPTRSRSRARALTSRSSARPVAAGGGGSASGAAPAGRQAPAPRRTAAGAAGGADELHSPLQGNMWKVLVKQGDTVEEGQILTHHRGDEDGERDHSPTSPARSPSWRSPRARRSPPAT